MPSNHRRLLPVCLVVLVVLAGCSGGPTPATETQPTATETVTRSTTETPTRPATTPTISTPNDPPIVTLRDRNGTTLGTVSVRIADTGPERRTGLSNTSSLADGEGMLFVYDREGPRTYVMRDMSFPLDIVFVAANGTITQIHHAETEPGESGGELTDYSGRGQYVLEVPRGYTNQTGVDVGDAVVVPDDL